MMDVYVDVQFCCYKPAKQTNKELKLTHVNETIETDVWIKLMKD